MRTVAAGNALIDPAVTRRVIAAFGRRAATKPPPALGELTARELEVLQLLARGLSNQEIADELIVGDATVKTHVARVLMKLGLRDRVQAVVFAYEHGIVEPAVPVPDAIAYVRAALPPPPARVLEIGAGDGALAAVLRGAGYDVTAIDPKGGDGVEPVALVDLDAPPRTLRRRGRDGLAAPRRAARRVAAAALGGHAPRRAAGGRRVRRRPLDERAAAWWLATPAMTRRPPTTSPRCGSTSTPSAQIREELAAWFDLGEPVPGAVPLPLARSAGAARRGGAADRRGRAARRRHALHRGPALGSALGEAAGALARRRVVEPVVRKVAASSSSESSTSVSKLGAFLNSALRRSTRT